MHSHGRRHGQVTVAQAVCPVSAALAPLWTIALALFPAVVIAVEPEPFDAVAPIFERHCVSCHQGENPKGKLDLATGAGVARGGASGALVDADQPEASLLLEKVSGDAPEMPPKAPPLSGEEQAALRRWIAAGAHFPENRTLRDRKLAGNDGWWSLQPLCDVSPPKLNDPWIRTPIDAFILAGLQQRGLEPSPDADRRTLLRRLTFDLHGLPPTPEELAAFLADSRPDAYERQVDRLLASPRYGERWARHWLDLVHYGETHGYDKDKPRPNAWPYRDYVIAALNADTPYSRFVQEQVAGDVLFPDQPAGIAATGFLVAGPWDYVGHVELREGTLDKRIARSNDRDDMVATCMSSFLSLTVHCARCHNHKFDPISQEEYYRLQAVFAGIDRADRPYDPDPAVHARRRQLNQELALATQRLEILVQAAASVTSPELKQLDEQLQLAKSRYAALPPVEGKPSPSNGYHSDILPQPDAVRSVQVDLGEVRPLERIVLVPARPTDFPDTPGFGFPLRYRLEVSNTPDFAAPRLVVDRTTADEPNPGDAPVVFKPERLSGRYVRMTATRLWKRTNDFVFALGEMEVWSSGSNVARGAKVASAESIEAGRWSRRYLVDGFDSRVSLEERHSAAGTERKQLEAEIERLAADRERAQAALLDPTLREGLAAARAKVASLDRERGMLPPPKHVYAAARDFPPAGAFTPARTPRKVLFLHRGNDATPGDEVEPGTLAALVGLPGALDLSDPADEGLRRAALARWLTAPQNALLRRSIVNRVWQYHFGRGLVDTPSDFGHQGALPTHPELLDWLARDFQNSGESLKQLHRRLVTSSVYRQSSAPRAEFTEIDSGNQLLWRMNRHRLEVEAVRDAVLAVSGQLDLSMGGPSVRQFAFKDDHSPVYDYELFDVDRPEGRRRSIYRFIVRSVPDPFVECLDGADPSLMVARRNTTVTPLQALALLNNRFMVRQAAHFSTRLETAHPTDLTRQLQLACELCWSRPPNPDEVRLLSDYAQAHGLPNACRLLLNSNEFLFVD